MHGVRYAFLRRFGRWQVQISPRFAAIRLRSSSRTGTDAPIYDV
jgi:hypothetical protein